MSILAWPKRLFYEYGSRVAIVLVKRRARKQPREPSVWLVLARLFEVRGDLSEAQRMLQNGLQACPGNPLLQKHLERIKEGKTITTASDR